ncbi:hypothetical protein LP421_29900 (plasmid) [Rhizobium sp. RCAM05350]|nr:hypothetical protein LP421_29900 [Rhizobium sp. RCAM05350]
MSEEYRNPNSAFEIEYLSYYAEAVATYRKRQPNPADHVAARVISDAIDGVIHNAARCHRRPGDAERASPLDRPVRRRGGLDSRMSGIARHWPMRREKAAPALAA